MLVNDAPSQHFTLYTPLGEKTTHTSNYHAGETVTS